jgi:methylmalonyl-CoA/ethylmalonyl-CoA epimerase
MEKVMGDIPFAMDHIGVAVKNLESGFQFYKALGYGEMEIEEVPSEKVRVGFIALNNACAIELLEPTSEDSPVAKFIAKRGEGIHHICLRVKGIEGVIKRLKDQGVQLINDRPKVGAHNCLVAFVHPRSTGGILLELSEKQNGVSS